MISTSYFFCNHAQMRMREMGLSHGEVLAVLAEPMVRYPGSPAHGSGRVVAVGGRLAVVYDPATRCVITILWHGLTRRDGRAA